MSKGTVLDALGDTLRTVRDLVDRTGLAESTVRKAIKDLVAAGQVKDHPCKPVLYSKAADSKEGATVERFLGNKARSADFLARRMRRMGLSVTPQEVRAVLLSLTAAGLASRPFRSQRFRRP